MCIFILSFLGALFLDPFQGCSLPFMCAFNEGMDVCLNDSDFLPEIHFPQSGNFLSKRKLNLKKH